MGVLLATVFQNSTGTMVDYDACASWQLTNYSNNFRSLFAKSGHWFKAIPLTRDVYFYCLIECSLFCEILVVDDRVAGDETRPQDIKNASKQITGHWYLSNTRFLSRESANKNLLLHIRIFWVAPPPKIETRVKFCPPPRVTTRSTHRWCNVLFGEALIFQRA